MKTMTVEVEAQVVSADRIPVNGRGVEYGRGWRENTEIVKRRIRLSRALKLTPGEKDFLAHMRKPWWNIINKTTLFVTFGTESGKTWHPKGHTGRTAANLIRKGLIDFASRSGTIGKLVLKEPSTAKQKYGQS